MKKTISLILSLVMLLSLIAGLDFSAYALSSGTCGSNLTYTFDSSTGTLTISGTGTMTSWTDNSSSSLYYENCPFYNQSAIKNIIINEGVTRIGDYSFRDCTSLSKVIIPNSVTSIGDNAFYGCRKLPNVTIPNGVTNIGNFAFYGCSKLPNVTIPNGVINIGKFAFCDCTSLSEVIIPNSVTSIGDFAFYKCSKLPNVTIPEGVKSIGASVFEDCTSLSEVIIPNSVTSIGDFAFDNCTGLKELTMPCSAEIYNSPYVFGSCTNIEKVILTEGTGIMQDYDSSTNRSDTYYQYTPWYISRTKCSEIILDDGIANVGNYAFYNCIGLTSVTIPNSVTSIGNDAFSDCKSLTSVTIPGSVKYIGSAAFYNCKGLSEVVLPDSYIYIGGNAFYNTGIYNNKEQWDNDVLYIGSHLIKSNQNISGHYEIKAGTKDIAGSAFYGCTNLQSVSIPDSVVGIGLGAFDNCTSLTSVTIPNSVKSIGDFAFEDCRRLTSVTIGNSVTSIGNSAFYGCTGLTSVTIPNSVTSIGSKAFEDCRRLTSVTIPDSVTNIGACAFLDCKSLKSVTIPNSVTNIDGGVFSDCTSLTSVTIPNSVTSIGNGAFDNCTSLTSVTIGNSVTSIGNDAFSDCKSLTSVTIPDSVISIGDSAFESCTGLKELTMPCSAKIYNSSYVFQNCTNIEKVILTKGTGIMQNYDFFKGSSDTYYQYTPWYISRTKCKDIILDNGITNIGNYAFYDCTGLTSITIPNGVTNIGTKAFNTLTDVTIPASAKIDFSGLDECVGLIRVHLTPGTGTMADWSSDYKDSLWYKHKNTIREINLDEGITNISDSAFHNCSNLTKTNIPNSVVSVGRYAYYGCSNLRKITILSPYCTIPNNANVIDDFATIYGYTGSTAEAYAKKFNRDFVSLGNYVCKAHTYKTYTTKATLSKSGSVITKCSVCGAVKSKSTIYYPKKITLSTTSYTYNGRAKKPTVKVVGSNGKTISSSNYTVSYASGRKYVGKYAVKVTFKGKYSGTKTLYFTIKPKSTSISSLKAGSKKFTVKWYKRSTQTTGYQVQYSTSSKFSSPKTVTISKTGTTSKTISKLKAKKKYYVRVRTYKTVNGTKYYSSWSKAKSVTTKS